VARLGLSASAAKSMQESLQTADGIEQVKSHLSSSRHVAAAAA
jgi:hypothetical protein